MEHLTLREATPADSNFAFLVRKVVFKEYVEEAGKWDEDEERRLHDQRVEQQDFRVISLGGVDVGILALVEASACIKLNQLFILPEWQGRGIGSECMRVIMAEARERGLPVRFRVLKVNQRARVFYQRLGFVCTGQTDTHVIMGGGVIVD